MKKLLLSLLLFVGVASFAFAQQKTVQTSKLKVKQKTEADLKTPEQIQKEKIEQELKKQQAKDAATRLKTKETATDDSK